MTGSDRACSSRASERMGPRLERHGRATSRMVAASEALLAAATAVRAVRAVRGN